MAKKGKLKKFQAVEKEERPIRFRRYQYLFLIVCEDENTEPTYFENFKIKIPERFSNVPYHKVELVGLFF